MRNTKNLYIIDSAVIDYGTLIRELPKGSEWIILNSEQDGLLQLQEILANYSQLDSIQILSHGSPGALYLGSTVLTENNLDRYDSTLAQIRKSLAEDADILLYGCEVGAGESGRKFINKLAEYCGANVAANENLTGAAELGGSWSLSNATNAIKAKVFESDSYPHVLITQSGQYWDEEFLGSTENDVIDGKGGNDTLSAGAGNDTLTGGDGTDTFNVTLGTDTITDLGVGGADILRVGYGAFATATIGAAWIATNASQNYHYNALVSDAVGVNIFTPGLEVNLSAISFGYSGYHVSNTGNAAVFTGSGFSDVLDGGVGDDTLIGFWGNDTLTGGAGNDSLTGGADRDTFVVSSGTDTITDLGYGHSQEVLSVTSGATANATVTATWIPTSASYNFGTANIRTSALAVNLSAVTAGNGYTVTNTGAATTFTGSSFADTLIGGVGNDSLTGGAGNDTFIVTSGMDTITDLGNGQDILTVALGATANVYVAAAWTATADSVNYGTENIITNGLTAKAVNLSAVTAGNGYTITNTGTATTFTGSSFADTLIGGIDNDTLIGGLGGDVYLVDSTTDVITELTGGGIDTIQSSVTYSLVDTDGAGSNGGNVENLTLTGYIAINAAGNSLDNVLTGNDANNILDGGAGNDALIGYAGQDSLVGGDGNDNLDGGSGSDTLNGGSGNDNLIGGIGNDSLTGGAGIDTFTVDSGTDTITDLGYLGQDILIVSAGATANATIGSAAWTATSATVNSGTLNISSNTFAVDLSAVTTGNGFSVTNISSDIRSGTTLTGSGGGDSLTGGAGNDTLVGGAGNDTLVGGVGNDSLTGGAGNDTFAVTSGTDTITDLGNGQDILTIAFGATANVTIGAAWTAVSSYNFGIASISTNAFAVDLSAVTSGNGFTVTNTGIATTLTGSSGNDSLTGGASDDTLTGGAGNDTLIGGLGGDVYLVDSTTDVITELTSGGIDTVQSSVTYSLVDTDGAGSNGGNVENLRLTGNIAINAIGNSLDNVLTGNDVNNILDGGAGNDTLIGGAGNDSLTGGAGNDTFTVTSGTDTITDWGNGQDTLTVTSGATANVILVAAWTAASSHVNSGIENISSNAFAVDLSAVTTGNGFTVTNTGTATTFTGSSIADTLIGGVGNDTLIGGLGGDVYLVDSTTDVITELTGGGIDTIQSSVTYSLVDTDGAGSNGGNVENLTLTGYIAINAAGNSLDKADSRMKCNFD